jgi:putative CocE/NonD family hydrolase
VGFFARRLGVREPEFRARQLEESSVPLRDGTRLRTLRIGPDDAGRHPALLVRTPYGIGWNPPLFLMPVVARFFARRGYQVVLQDTRGRYGSGGEFYPLRPEADDGRDTLEWISKQPWFDGNLGMWGVSYFGYTQWSVAADPPPYLKALVPILTTADMHGMFYPGGAFSLATALRWAAGNGERRGRRAPERRLPAAARTRPLRRAVEAAGRHAPFFADWVDHPERDDYWRAIDRLDARGTRVPVLSVAGSYDIFCGPQLEDFATLGPESSLDLGPLAHGSYAIRARKLGWRNGGLAAHFASQLAFLDHRLQGRPLARPRVRRYVIGEDRWLDESAWPPPDSRVETLYLRAGGRLEREAPGGDEPPDRYVYDPADPVPTFGGTFLGPRCGPADQRALADRLDVRCFDTPPLARALELAGPVRARLRVGSDAPATDFTAKLVWLPADARRPALNLCEGIARLHAARAEAQPVDIDLWHASARIPAGDRLRLEISSSNFPRFDAHPNVAGHPGHATRAQPAGQTLHHAKDAPSWLEIRVTSRGASD